MAVNVIGMRIQMLVNTAKASSSKLIAKKTEATAKGLIDL